MSSARGLFLAMACIVLLSTAVTYTFGLRVMHTRNQSLFHKEAINRLERVLSTLTDAETGQRGFLVTGEERYLQPYARALSRLPRELNAVAELKEAHIPAEAFQKLKTLVAAKLAELRENLALAREQGMESAFAGVRSGSGKQIMDGIRAEIGRLIAEQEAKFHWDIQEADRATRIRSGISALMALISLTFIVWSYRRISRAIQAHRAATVQAETEHAEAERQKNLLHVTLASIGDSVIVTDLEGRITFMNAVAERQTGWSLSEALFHPAGEVFKIINETTREPVESPVQKVLKHGVIVGLANHTLLIRKDGVELPIDDSGAPIRESDGTIRGVVLVFRDFTEHKIAQEKLKEAKEAAETANQAKDQFLAILSHELRTPLTPVLATLNLWDASEELPDTLRSDVRMLQRNVELEARIIDDLLDLTRIAKGMLSFSPEDTDVHQLLEFVLGMCRTDLESKRLRVITTFQAVRSFVHTDVSRFQQVIWNILTNACKFSENNGAITVHTANDAQGNVRITIMDTGIGMAEETISRLFLPFEQGERQISRRYGGLGLGMAISRALVELLGGKISATSEGVGRGSSFTVCFPTIEEKMEKRPAVPKNRSNDRPGALRILLVEDHVDTATTLTRLLTRRGYEVVMVGTVASAIETAQAGTFDLLLSDLGLPDGTGFEVVQKIRAMRSMPALALSGFGMEEDVTRCNEAGFDAHLTKPVNFQNLDAMIWKLTATGRTALATEATS